MVIVMGYKIGDTTLIHTCGFDILAFMNIMKAMLVNESVYMPVMHVMLPVLRTVYAGRWNSLALSISRYTMPACARLRMSVTPAVKSIKK